MSEDPELDDVVALLDDDYARAILTATSEEPMSASTLSERCDASLPTVYRRVDRLTDCNLVSERTEVGEDGNHYSVYEAQLDRIEIDLEEGALSMDIDYQEDVADKFTRMWEGMR